MKMPIMRINTKLLSKTLASIAVALVIYMWVATTQLLETDSTTTANAHTPISPRASPITQKEFSGINSSAATDYRLEFLHIPKTGGTLIEVIAKEHGVSWGACKFLPPWRLRPGSKSNLKDCPVMTKPQFKSKEALWHYPIPLLLQKDPSFVSNDPYDNLPPSQKSPKHKKFFAVIRNPYSWFISLYTMCPPCFRRESLNEYVQAWFEKKRKDQVNYCQYEFLYNTSSPMAVDKNGIHRYSQRIVDPDLVVRMESLQTEMEALWVRHGYNWRIPSKDERPINQHKTQKILSLYNFSKASLELIHDRCRLDFVEGPYEMVDLRNWKDPE